MSDGWHHPARIESIRCLRLTLRGPLTLGHVLLLDELDSPVITGRPIELGELGISVLVCSEPTAKEARKLIESRWAAFALRRWGRLCGELDHGAEAARFVDWFSAQCGGPEQKVRQGAGQIVRENTAPWFLSRLAAALGELGLTHTEAEAVPMKRLNQLLCALAELRGQQEFWSDKEDEQIALIRRWEAEKVTTE